MLSIKNVKKCESPNCDISEVDIRSYITRSNSEGYTPIYDSSLNIIGKLVSYKSNMLTILLYGEEHYNSLLYPIISITTIDNEDYFFILGNDPFKMKKDKPIPDFTKQERILLDKTFGDIKKY